MSELSRLGKNAHGATHDEGVWLFDELLSASGFEEYVGPVRLDWDEVPALITWLTQKWAEHNFEERRNA